MQHWAKQLKEEGRHLVKKICTSTAPGRIVDLGRMAGFNTGARPAN
jgi:hypothetical protein